MFLFAFLFRAPEIMNNNSWNPFDAYIYRLMRVICLLIQRVRVCWCFSVEIALSPLCLFMNFPSFISAAMSVDQSFGWTNGTNILQRVNGSLFSIRTVHKKIRLSQSQKRRKRDIGEVDETKKESNNTGDCATFSVGASGCSQFDFFFRPSFTFLRSNGSDFTTVYM